MHSGSLSLHRTLPSVYADPVSSNNTDRTYINAPAEQLSVYYNNPPALKRELPDFTRNRPRSIMSPAVCNFPSLTQHRPRPCRPTAILQQACKQDGGASPRRTRGPSGSSARRWPASRRPVPADNGLEFADEEGIGRLLGADCSGTDVPRARRRPRARRAIIRFERFLPSKKHERRY